MLLCILFFFLFWLDLFCKQDEEIYWDVFSPGNKTPLVANYLLKLPRQLALTCLLATVKMALSHWQSHYLEEHWCLSLACLCCEWSTNYGQVLCFPISEMWNYNYVWYWVVKTTLTLRNFDSLILWNRFSYTEAEKCFCNNKSRFNVFEMSAGEKCSAMFFVVTYNWNAMYSINEFINNTVHTYII